MKKNFMTHILLLIAFAFYFYVELPVLNLRFTSMYILLILFFGIVGILSLDRTNLFHFTTFAKVNIGIALVLLAIVVIAPTVTSIPLLHASSYRNLLGDVVESDFTKDVSPVSVSDIRLVDKSTAIRLGAQKIGSVMLG